MVQTVPLRRSLILRSVPAAMLSLGSQQAGVPLRLKSFVLRQVTQALAYLHSQNSPLIHHDLSPNNVLLNMVSFVAKLTDLGVSRAINPSAISRKSSINGTPAFTSSEALHPPPLPSPSPCYNAKLDVFGNTLSSHTVQRSRLIALHAWIASNVVSFALRCSLYKRSSCFSYCCVCALVYCL